MIKIDLIFACQAMINSYDGKHGIVKPIFEYTEWHTCDNDIFHFGYLGDDLYIVITGSTGEWADWQNNAECQKLVIPYDGVNPEIKVHKGFLLSYKKTEFRDVVLNKTKEFENIFVIGHSRGGAIAHLAAVDIHYNYHKNITCITGGSPRVGNKTFADSYNRRIPENYRIVNGEDYITKLPYNIMGYWHVDKLIQIGKQNPVLWIPFVRTIGVNDHYPQKYLENIKKYGVT